MCEMLVWVKAGAVTKKCRVSRLQHQFVPVLPHMIAGHVSHQTIVFALDLQELEQKRARQAAEAPSTVEAELEGLSTAGGRSPLSPADIKAKNTGQCEVAEQPSWVQYSIGSFLIESLLVHTFLLLLFMLNYRSFYCYYTFHFEHGSHWKVVLTLCFSRF